MAPASRPLRAAIIDLDGTLVDTVGDFDLALNRTLAELGLAPVDRAFITRTVGKGSEHLIRSTLAQVEGDEALYPRPGPATSTTTWPSTARRRWCTPVWKKACSAWPMPA